MYSLPPLLRLVPVVATVLAVLAPTPAVTPRAASKSAGAVSSGVALGAATSGASSGALGPGRWAWPLDPAPPVLARFEAPPDPYAAGHRGVDLAAAPGQVVLSPTEGRVTFAGAVAGRPVVVVSHAGGLRSTFEPVVEVVAVGGGVARGAVVGVLAPTATATSHCAPASCLHWGVLRGPVYLDPLTFVGAARVVLLPLRP